jgi:hypothetical protein
MATTPWTVVPIDEMKKYLPYLGTYKYIRNNFWAAGQDSYSLPPAQDQSLFMQLTNCQPTMQGTLQRRWGYELFNNSTSTLNPFYFNSYQRDVDGLRKIVNVNYDGTMFTALGEDGSLYVNVSPPGNQTRGITSRDWYYMTGSANVKWSGITPPSAPTAANDGAGSISGSHTYQIALTDTYGHPSKLSAATTVVSSSNAVKVTSPPAQTLVTDYQVYINGHYQTTTAIGTDTVLTSYNSSGAAFLEDGLFMPPWGVAASEFQPTFTSGGSTDVTLTVGRIYTAVGMNSLTGHVTDLAPFSVSTGPVTSSSFTVTVGIYPDTQIDLIVLLATSDGGNEETLYEVGTVANIPGGVTTTITDDVPELTLLSSAIYQQSDQYGNLFGCALNQPPQAFMTSIIKHQGRLWGIVGQIIYFSKSINEVTTSTDTVAGHYEECWPADNFFDISEHAETGRALQTDGTTLYIGSERRIYRLTGSTPQTFQEPQVTFNDVGVFNQDVWQIVFKEGQPVGTIWMTPDYRVLLSDFNTYQDIGHPVQDVLNTFSPNGVYTYQPGVGGSQGTAQAMFIASGSYDLYMLAIPTGTQEFSDTLLVYNLRTNKWIVWYLTDLICGMLFNVAGAGTLTVVAGTPQLIFSSATVTGLYYIITPGTTQDRLNNTPVSYGVTIQTSWLDLGDPTVRKVLNEVEVITGDTGLTVTVEAASLQADFASPVTVVSNLALVASTLGELKAYLAQYATTKRYYRFTFTSANTSTIANVLEGFNVETVPFHRE